MAFRDALNIKDFAVSAELALTPDSSRASILADAEIACDYVDGFLLTDNQYGQPHMAPSAAASILLGGGYSPILQLSCRNRNRIALLGELLGARALGIDSLMLVRGSKVPEGYKPRPKAVMDIDLLGTFHVMRAVHPHLHRPGASVINISAPQAFIPMQAQIHVSAAKAGVDEIH